MEVEARSCQPSDALEAALLCPASQTWYASRVLESNPAGVLIHYE
jgi:hypothetical protein